MGIMKKFFNQTRKPEGTLGKLMLSSMNSGHAFTFGGLLATLPTQERFDEFKRSLGI